MVIGKNYDLKPFLITNNLMGYMDGSIPCPSKTLSVTDGATILKENPNYPIWVSNDAHVRMLIISTISEASFRHVQAISNASANWHLDTGATSHVTPDLEAMDNSELYYGDDALHVGNGTLRQERIINSFDGDDLVFEFMIGFRKFTAYREPFLPMNIISPKAYNTIIIEGLEGMRKNLVAIVKDVYVFVGSFTYITDFVVLADIGEFIMSDMAEVLMGRRFRKITKLEYDVGKGLVSFTKIFDTYTYRMPRTIPRLKNFN
ncbi:hypothetical protein Tco_0452987 [Tanacetum coccineum]